MMNSLRKTAGGGADYGFVILLAILLGVGLIALTSASAPLGYARFHDSYYFIKKQILFGLLPGVLLFLLVAKIGHQQLQRFSWGIYIGCLGLLLLRFVPGVGAVINGARNWINVAGISLQPSEFAKLGVIILVSYLLGARDQRSTEWPVVLWPILLILLPAILLIADVGTLSIVGFSIFIMLFVANVPMRYLVTMGLIAVISFFSLVIIAPKIDPKFNYRVQRLTTFLHPELDPQGVGYQVNQAFLAVGSGGWWGLGLGHSRQKFQYLPEVNADSIFAVIAEETGFIFAGSLIILILMIGWRGLKIAAAAPDESGKLLVCGIMAWFIWQSFLNIGAMVGALPLTGVPLPFVSHGGSALLSILGACGLVVSVSKGRVHKSR